MIETDHRTFIICSCGTNIGQQPFEEIWNILMPILNHFEEMFLNFAPSKNESSFNRQVELVFSLHFQAVNTIDSFNVPYALNFRLW